MVKNTIYASQGIDWPKDKLNIWILMTKGRGRVSPVRERCRRTFTSRVPVTNMPRPAYQQCAEVCERRVRLYFFDCDHVPTRSFLQMTMGWFLKDKKLAMMRTPHHSSPDPFERNLGRFRKTPK